MLAALALCVEESQHFYPPPAATHHHCHRLHATASRGLIVWVLGAEVQSLETRASGMSVVMGCNSLMAWAIGGGEVVGWVVG